MTELIQLEIPEAVAIPPDGFVNVFYTEEDGLIVKKGKFHDGTVKTLAEEYEPLPYDPEPFTIIAKEATVVSLNETGDVTGTDLYYSLNGGEWEAYAFGTSVTLESQGNFVRFWNKTNLFSQSNNNYLKFRIDRDVSFAGNIMSLLNFSNRCTAYCFSILFSGCTALTEAPVLPATELAASCYANMFNDCTSLTKAPVLPATTLAKYCYYSMFFNCTNLTIAPALPATELVDYCYYYMFYRCTSLSSIKVHFTDWQYIIKAHYSWVTLVPSTGTFYMPSTLPVVYGTSNIPEGWTIEIID